VEQSDDEAVMWVVKAAEQGYQPSLEALKKDGDSALRRRRRQDPSP